jgi:hypothetical protein
MYTVHCGCEPLNMGTAPRPKFARFWQSQVKPGTRVRLGEAFAALGRKINLRQPPGGGQVRRHIFPL